MGNLLSGPSEESQLVEGTGPWYRYHARKHTNQSHAAFANSKAAYSRGDHSGAKKLSAEGKEHQRRAKEFNDKAAALCFEERNHNRAADEVDLHGLKVSCRTKCCTKNKTLAGLVTGLPVKRIAACMVEPPTVTGCLQVTEAIEFAQKAIEQAKADGRKRLVLIVGQGKHSADGVPKLKPAVLSMINKHNLRCYANRPNPG